MLTIYRRHSPVNPAIKESGCKVHYPGLLKGNRIMTGKQKTKYLDCDCPLWSRGPNQPGRSLGTNDLKVALAMVQAKDAKSKDVAVHGKTIEDAIETFLKRSTSRIKGVTTEIKNEKGDVTGMHYTGTLGAYAQILRGRLLTFCHAQNIHHIQQLGGDMIETFKTDGLGTMKDSSRTTATKYLRRFLKMAFVWKWITTPLHAEVSAHPSKTNEKKPFTKAEVATMLTAAENMNDGTEYGSDGPRLRLLMEFALETGMRRGDVVRYLPSKAIQTKQGVWKYTFRPQKTGKTVEVKLVTAYISHGLKTAIDACKWMSADRPFAYSVVDLRDDSTTDTTTLMGEQLYSRFQAIGKKYCVDDCRPHRLRSDRFGFGHESVLAFHPGPYRRWSYERMDRDLCKREPFRQQALQILRRSNRQAA